MKRCNFQFKGKRDYVHGTDMYKKALETINKDNLVNITKIDFSINSMARNDCELIIENKKVGIEKPKDFVARMIIQEVDKTWRLWLVETNEPISKRYEYDEKKIKEASTISDRTISAGYCEDYDTIEAIVALNKILLSKTFSNLNGKWVFSRLTLDRATDTTQYEKIKLNFTNNLSNKLFKSELIVNGKAIGYIYFSLTR